MAQSVVKTYAVAGTYPILWPKDVTAPTVELIGAGGTGGPATGNPSRGGGGAGGQYVSKVLSVTGGSVSTLVVPAASSAATGSVVNGGDATLDSTVAVAKGGAGGANATGTSGAGGSGSTTGGVGDTVNAGGNGAAGTAGGVSGGGGGGAGSTGAGGNASAGTAGTGTSQLGGNGGAGISTANTRNAGSQAGGGGSGGLSSSTTDRSGGNGGAGYARISYSTSDVDVVASVSGKNEAVAATTLVLAVTTPSGYTQTGLLVRAETYSDDGIAAARILSVVGSVDGAFTKLKAQDAPGGVFNSVEAWYLANPTVGAQNITITITGGAGNAAISGIADNLINVAASQADATNGGTTSGANNTSISVTSVTDRSVIFSASTLQIGAGGVTVGAGQALTYAPSTTEAFSHSAAKTPAGAVAHTYAGGDAADNWTNVSVAIKQYTAPSGVNSGFFAFA